MVFGRGLGFWLTNVVGGGVVCRTVEKEKAGSYGL